MSWLILALASATPTGTVTGSPTGTPGGTTTGAPDALVVMLSPLGAEIDPSEALFLEVAGFGCEDFEVLDQLGELEPSVCDEVGPTADGQALVIRPDVGWSGTVARLHFTGVGAELVSFAVVPAAVDVDVEAVAVSRVVSFDGVSQRVCREGPIAGVSLGPTEPVMADQILRPSDETIYHGVSDGSWPEAAPEADGTFWFVTWDRAGERKAWQADPVTLASDGMVRTDLRLGFNGAEPTVCPAASGPWTIGDEVEAQGAELPQTPPDDDEKQGDCGCQSGGGPLTGWLWLWLVALVGRRYQSPGKPNSTSA